MRLSLLPWLICSLLLAALLVFAGPSRLLSPPSTAQGEALIGGEFELVDGDNMPVHSRDFKGRYMLVYFGFTHCPDICPTTLLVIKNALDALDTQKKRIVPIFISVDPERDTPPVIKQYTSNFGQSIVGLTGTLAQVKKAADSYRVYFSKVSQDNSASEYLVDHSGFMYLMDTQGRYIAHFSHSISETELTQKLRQFVK